MFPDRIDTTLDFITRLDKLDITMTYIEPSLSISGRAQSPRKARAEKSLPGLSARGKKLYDDGELRNTLGKVVLDPYDPEKNPDGFINLGTADNSIMRDEVADFVNSKVDFNGNNIDYGEGPWGNTAMREAMATYMNKYFEPTEPIKEGELLMTTGLSSMFEMLGFTIAEAHDGILTGMPMYAAFKPDFGVRAKVDIVGVDFKERDPFSLDAIEVYEKAIRRAESSGQRIRAILLCNPHNPLGRCYKPKVLTAYMDLCCRHKIHLLVDEIYAMSVYEVENADDDERVPFTSALATDWRSHISPNYFHVMYGFSKDLAAGGLRLGLIWTRSKALLQALGGMSNTNWPGNADEAIGRAMLTHDDGQWVNGFLDRAREGLSRGSAITRKQLKDLGIKWSKGANAGFFLYVDLRSWLETSVEDQSSPDDHSSLREQHEDFDTVVESNKWAGERKLAARLMKAGIFITPGESMAAAEPGFFRICFAKPEKELRAGLERMKKCLLGKDDD